MSAGKMSDGSPVTPELDARMLADLREWRARVTGNEPISVALILDELDMLLRIAAERDALRRQACEMPDERSSRFLHSEPGAECTHEAWEEFGGVRRCADCRVILAPLCATCSSAIVPDRHSTGGWRHAVRPIRIHAAKPIA